jgi:hypothetical protein
MSGGTEAHRAIRDAVCRFAVEQSSRWQVALIVSECISLGVVSFQGKLSALCLRALYLCLYLSIYL